MLVRNVTTDIRGPFGEGAKKDGNSIFIFEVAGLCIGHLGHLHQIPTLEQYAAIGRLDVVMVPVDGGYTMRLEDMAGVVRHFRSSVVIPMHWFSAASLRRFLDEMAPDFAVVETGARRSCCRCMICRQSPRSLCWSRNSSTSASGRGPACGLAWRWRCWNAEPL
jgi:hypothetical protein